MDIIIFIIRMVTNSILFLAILYTAYTFGEYISEVLPHKNKIFNRKPFNCRPCSTFWTSIALTTTYSITIYSLKIFVAGLIASLVMFFIVRISDKRKIIE